MMNSDVAKRLAAMAIAAGCILGPAVAHAQAANESAQANDVEAVQKAPAATNDAAESAKMPQAAGASDDVPEGAAQGEAVEAAKASPEQVKAGIKSAFEKEFPGIVLDDVKPTRFAGIYEVRIGTDLLYTNERVDYVMQGSLIDARNKEDLTAKSLDALMAVAFESLPLESAIKQVKGDGSRKMVVFEDPNCGYCKRLHQTLDGMDNYTVYTLLFPILSPDSKVKARNIWCASDRTQAWRNQMLKGEAPPDAQCETPIEANLALGRKLLVRGTPAIIFEDGSRVNGALPKDALEQRLDAATAAMVR